MVLTKSVFRSENTLQDHSEVETFSFSPFTDDEVEEDWRKYLLPPYVAAKVREASLRKNCSYLDFVQKGVGSGARSNLKQNCSRHFFLPGFGHFPRRRGRGGGGF